MKQRGISPVIGVILLVALTVILSATVGVTLSNSAQPTDSSVSDAVKISEQSPGTYKIQLLKDSEGQLEIYTNNDTNNAVILKSAGDTATAKLQQGDTLNIISNKDGSKTLVNSIEQSTSGADSTTINSNAEAPPSGPQVTNGLVAHWNFEDSSDSIVTDSAGEFANDATILSGTSRTTDSKVGSKALSFSGNGELDVVEPGNEIAFTGSHTITLWAKTNYSTTDKMAIFSHASGRNDANPRFWFAKRNGNTNVEYVLNYDGFTSNDNMQYQESTHISEQGSPLFDGTWNHYAAVYDMSAGERYLYINGTQVASQSFSGPLEDGPNVTIGHYKGKFNYEGTLDDMRLYNRPLTGSEIQTISEE